MCMHLYGYHGERERWVREESESILHETLYTTQMLVTIFILIERKQKI